MTEPRDDAVVVARSRGAGIAMAVVFAALAVSLGRYLLGGPAGSAVGWFFALLLLLAFVFLAVSGVRSAMSQDRLVLDGGGATEERKGATTRTALAEMRQVEFHPAEATTWTGPSRPGEPKLLARSRTEARLRLTGHGFDTSLFTSQSAWPDAVRVVHGWVRERPELVEDDVTRAFFAGLDLPVESEVPTRAPVVPPGTTRQAVRVAVAALYVVLAVGLVATALVLDAEPDAQLFAGAAFGSLLLTGLVVYVVATTVPVLQALVHLARGNPWWLFRPRRDGRYSWLVSGRMSSLRAPRGGSALGLAVRWVVALLLVATAWLPALAVGWFVVLLVQL